MPRGIPTFFVEGDLEKIFLNSICGNNSRVLKIPNGKTVSPNAIARQVSTIVKASNIEPSYVVVIADREQRTETSQEIENKVSVELRQLGLNIPFSVHVPDKMVENWILADEHLIKNEGLNVVNAKEGKHGKSEIKRAFKEKKLNYKERIDGVRLLKACSAKRIKNVSPSFDRLYKTLTAGMATCNWLQS